MNRMLTVCVLALSCGLVMAGSDLKKAAEDVCNCMAEPNKMAAKIIEKLQQAQATGDMSKMMSHRGEMMGVMNAATRCFETLPAKHPDINRSKALQDKVMAMAEQLCPNPAMQFAGQR